MSSKKKEGGFSRRKFIVRSAVGVGVILGGGYLSKNLVRRYLAGMANTLDFPYLGDTEDPSMWFEVLPDNRILLHSPKIEMGQGIFTGLAQIAADELEVDLTQLYVVHAHSSSGNIDGFATGGSNTISGLWQPLRELAATMREMLKTEAAARLGVNIEDLMIRNGQAIAGDRMVTYGELAAEVKEWEVPDVPTLKPWSDYKYIGKPIPRVDLVDKVIGINMFGLDATMPDMLYGSIVKPDQIGARFISADISRAEAMPDVVKVVVEKDFVGVVAKNQVVAVKAKKAIEVNWEFSTEWQTDDIEQMIEVGRGNPVTVQKNGNPAKLLKDNGILESEYRSPIGAHAQIEPNAAVAYVLDDKAAVMLSTQAVALTRKEVAQSLGLKEKNVNIMPSYPGGGFGGRLHSPHASQIALLSKAVGRPVKCIFDRKEEFQNDTFRPPTHHVLRAKLNGEGNIEAIEHHVSSGDVMFSSPLIPGIGKPLLGADAGVWRGGMFQYGAIPNYRTVSWWVKLPFVTNWWRGLGLLANTFAIESFIDELALHAGKDPAEFRLEHIQDDDRGYRLKEVIKTVVTQTGYGDELLPNGHALGLAASTDTNTPCAQIAEVSIEDGEIKVHKVTCVMDPGLVINPDQVKAQCEGAIIMGMSAAMYEKMTVKDGQMQPTIYGPYRMALMRDAPKEIEVILLKNSELPGAVGEPPIGPIGAAIANAAFRLTGKRLRSMPLVE